MKISELREIFDRNTRFYLEKFDSRFEINNLLFGTQVFINIDLTYKNLKAIGENKIAIELHDMPIEVFEAWKKYSETKV